METSLRRPRLFVGIALDDTTRSACAEVAARLETYGFEARYEAPEKLHITLAFLGNVDFDRFADVEAVMREVAAASEPFILTLDRLGAFPNERRPRIVFVGSRDQGAEYRALAARTREAYAQLGFPFEDDAVAHVTIARVKHAHRHPRPLPPLDVTAVRLFVDQIALFESIPDKGTTRYEIRTALSLG